MATASKFRLNIDVPVSVNEFLDEYAQESGTTKSDVIRKAVALLKVALTEKQRGRVMGFVTESKEKTLDAVVVGLF